ncbi:autotransporter, partial [Azospirillum brasilense]|nr:autotransporter [Azospirillum brasilense]
MPPPRSSRRPCLRPAAACWPAPWARPPPAPAPAAAAPDAVWW